MSVIFSSPTTSVSTDHLMMPAAKLPPHLPVVAVVIPAYRASASIKQVLEGIPLWVAHIIVIDDASPDNTVEVLSWLTDSRLHLVRHEVNQGVGGAVLSGYEQASALGAEIIVKMDSDGQMNPAWLPALIEPLQRGEADYVKGNRFLHVRELTQMPLLRRIGNLGLSFLTKAASGQWHIFDPTNGYTAINAALVPLLNHERIHRRYFFESSMLLELGWHRAVVRDVYIPARYGAEKSSLSEWQALHTFPWLLLRGLVRRIIFQYFLRDFTTVSLFLLIGNLALWFGLGWGGYHWYLSGKQGVVASTGTVMIAVLPIILGFQLLLQALATDIQSVPREPIHRTQHWITTTAPATHTTTGNR
jgi:dolichol-phosphate mannosyltransferase